MTASQLMAAARNRRCVIYEGQFSGRNIQPAAFVVNMSFCIVMARLPKMKLYKKQKRYRLSPKWCTGGIVKTQPAGGKQ
jgi:hypothetical protein